MNEKKCDYCGEGKAEAFKVAKGKEIKVEIRGRQMPAIAYTCPLCEKVISIELNPFAMNQELIRELQVLLQK